MFEGRMGSCPRLTREGDPGVRACGQKVDREHEVDFFASFPCPAKAGFRVFRGLKRIITGDSLQDFGMFPVLFLAFAE